MRSSHDVKHRNNPNFPPGNRIISKKTTLQKQWLRNSSHQKTTLKSIFVQGAQNGYIKKTEPVMEEHVTRLLAVALSVTMGRYGQTTGGLRV